MDGVERLLAIEEIKQLKARRVRAVDDKDWDLYRDCHTPGCVSHALDPPTRGNAEMTEQLKRSISDRTTVHHVHSPEIEILSDTEASGIWAMEDMLWWEERGQKLWLHGYGRYHETYEKLDGHWLIASRRLERIRVDTGVEGQPDVMQAGR